MLIAYGSTVSVAMDAAKALAKRGVPTGVCLLESLAPYTEAAAALAAKAEKGSALLFLEEGIRTGGAGMCLFDALLRERASFLEEHAWDILAVDGHFAAPDRPCSLSAFCGLDEASVVARVLRMTGKSGKEMKEL